MLPHLAAFRYLLPRVNKHARQRPGVAIIHDRQTQFDVTLQDSLSFLESMGPMLSALVAGTAAGNHADWSLANRIELTFADSEAEPGIQAADIIARFCIQRMANVLLGAAPSPGFKSVVDTLHDVGGPRSGVGVNIVATTKAAATFWSA